MKHVFNRRDFMKVSGGAVAVLTLSRCSVGGGTAPAMGQFSGGNIADYALGDVMRFDAGPFFVGYDDNGLYAMSAVCTHAGCTVNPGAVSLNCPCHGTTFDLNGDVTGGPAPRALDHYAVTIDDIGDITVDTEQVVSSSTRTPVT